MTELWRQCAGWLLRLEVLPENHRVVWPDATIEDVAYTLRDGVLLCHVANAIDPAAVDMKKVNQRPQMAQFLCLKNIRTFLSCLPSIFSLKETDLFQPSHLYDYTDFARVLHTLSKLSNCAKANARSVPGFPQQPRIAAAQGDESPLVEHEEEAQIYRTLEELVNEDNYKEFYYQHHGGGGSSGGSLGFRGAAGAGTAGGGAAARQYYTAAEQEEVIYEDLCSFKSKSSSLLQQQQLNFQPKEKRDYCIKELIETEGSYVDVLNMLRKHFIRPISTMKDADKKVVFMNIKELGESHAAFYQEVLESMAGKSRKRIGEIFLEFKERFLKYGEYCSSLSRAQELLDSLMSKDDAIRDEVSKCELAANDGKFRLRDLLTVPMQRVLKYHLILRQLMSNTATTHEEYHLIQQAYEAMLDVSDYINEVKRDSEQLQIIREIQKSITEWNMPPGLELKDYGRLRKDSELKVQCHGDGGGVAAVAAAAGMGAVGGLGGLNGNAGGGSGKTKIRYVFVFDKVMLMCKATRGDHYSYKDSLKLSDYKVQDVSASSSQASSQASTGTLGTHARRLTQRVGSDSRWAFSFHLVHVQNLHAYTMWARTEEDKNKWVAAIREALGNVLPLGPPPAPVLPGQQGTTTGSRSASSSHEVHMHTFEKPVSCDYCYRLLKGLFYQGYRCEKCGRSLHKECIALSAKCGSGPPRLPPRPPSMQLPTPNAGTGIHNRFSSVSIDLEAEKQPSSLLLSRQSSSSLFGGPAPLGLQPPMAPLNAPPPMLGNGCGGNGMNQLFNSVVVINGSNPDYINTKMEDHSWYVGNMDRDSANTELEDFPQGAFLVRCRVHATNGDKLGYALSLKTEFDVKHMKIDSTKSGGNFFYLSDTRKFRSVVELVSWFSRNSLKEAFSGLDATLRFSVGELSLVEATFDFSPPAAGGVNAGDKGNMLPLKAGDTVTVIDKSGDSQGWWKAYNGVRVGFVPKEFVQEARRRQKNGTASLSSSAAASCSVRTASSSLEMEDNKSSLDKDGNLDKEEVDIGNLGIVVNISEEGAASDVTNAAV